MPRCTDTEIQVALCELQMLGFLEFDPSFAPVDAFRLTEKGLKHGVGILDAMPVADRLVLMLTKDQLMSDAVEDM